MKLCMYACMYVTMQHKDKDGRPQSLAFLLPTTPGKRGGGGGGGGKGKSRIEDHKNVAGFDCKKYNNETSSSKLVQSLNQEALETKCPHTKAVRKTKFYNKLMSCPLCNRNSWTNRSQAPAISPHNPSIIIIP